MTRWTSAARILPLSSSLKRLSRPQPPADKKIVGVHHFPANFCLCPAKADIGNLVLPAARGTPAEMNANLVLIPSRWSSPTALMSSIIRFLVSATAEIAKLDAGAGDASLAEIDES